MHHFLDIHNLYFNIVVIIQVKSHRLFPLLIVLTKTFIIYIYLPGLIFITSILEALHVSELGRDGGTVLSVMVGCRKGGKMKKWIKPLLRNVI